jgi:hypothetical protein
MYKKISFVGNVGNCTYWYVKYLRQAGVDAWLYITFKKYDKNKKPIIIFGQDPRNEDRELGGILPFWVKFFHVHSIKNFFNIKKEFDRYDLNIAFESLPIFLQFSKKPLISFATGSNLREQAFNKGIKGMLLKRGFRKSKLVLFDNIDMVTIKCFEKLGIKKYQWLPCYLPPENPPSRSETKIINNDFFKKIKEKFIFFSSSRLDFSQKGTDILIRGFANFIKKNKNLAKLLIIDFGKDKEETKKLIEKLNIKNSISILPVLSREEIINLNKESSLTFGYFKNNNSGVHHFPFSIMDALKTGNISISSIDSEAFLKIVGEEPPVLKACSEKELEDQMIFAIRNYNKIKNDFSVRGPLWIKKYHSKEFITEKLLKIINKNV